MSDTKPNYTPENVVEALRFLTGGSWHVTLMARPYNAGSDTDFSVCARSIFGELAEGFGSSIEVAVMACAYIAKAEDSLRKAEGAA